MAVRKDMLRSVCERMLAEGFRVEVTDDCRDHDLIRAEREGWSIVVVDNGCYWGMHATPPGEPEGTGDDEVYGFWEEEGDPIFRVYQRMLELAGYDENTGTLTR